MTVAALIAEAPEIGIIPLSRLSAAEGMAACCTRCHVQSGAGSPRHLPSGIHVPIMLSGT